MTEPQRLLRRRKIASCARRIDRARDLERDARAELIEHKRRTFDGAGASWIGRGSVRPFWLGRW